jgi:hypothetical protein
VVPGPEKGGKGEDVEPAGGEAHQKPIIGKPILFEGTSRATITESMAGTTGRKLRRAEEGIGGES